MPLDKKAFEIFKYGSAWVSADFHLHTRADKQFVYAGESHSFLNDYVAKLKEKNIHAGVVANHNKFNKDEFINLRKKARKEGIFLLPGLELSVNDGANGIHTIIVFSDHWMANGNDYINPFITTMFPGKSTDEYQNADGRSDKNILQVIEELEKTNRDYFIIFPHVEQTSGLWEEMRGGKLGDFSDKRYALARNRILAFQKVRSQDRKNKVKQLLAGWYPAEVEGSDCKSIEEIGGKEGETWLKIGDFTFESIKYALVDYQNRIRPEKPEFYRHSHIKEISFNGGVLNGKTIALSPELNTFIGIRGSGKSSILESIRYVLGIPFGEKALDTDYKTRLVAHTFGSGGEAVITARDQYDREFQIKRILNELPECYADGKLQPGISIRETIIKKPIYFGQKDLAVSVEGFEKDLVEKLTGESLYEIRRKIEDEKQLVADIVSRLQKLARIDDQIEEYMQKKRDAEFNLLKFGEYGIEEKFKKQIEFDMDERKIIQMINDTERYRDDFDSFIGEHEDTIKNHLSYSSKQNQSFFTDFLAEYTKTAAILENHKTDKTKIDEILDKMNSAYTGFIKMKNTFIDEFAETRRKIEAELKAKGGVLINLEEYPGLKSKIDTAVKMLDVLEKQKSAATTVNDELIQALIDLNNLWQQEFQVIKTHLDKINNNSSALAIEAEFKGGKSEFLTFMKSVFKGSKIRESIFLSLVNDYSDFANMYRDFDNAKKKAGSTPETFEKIFNENLQALLVYQVQNKYSIKYRGKALQHHSLGQRASALILFVLNQQENDVIIIDQPEDDLDNQTIYEDVIKLIRELKPHTQFLFATHNANFPVLGDAEQIHSCRYEDDKVDIKSGSIDSPVLQREIVDIMEGGEDAFNKRKEIYGIWKPQNS